MTKLKPHVPKGLWAACRWGYMAANSLPRDLGNALRYGLNAPMNCQAIFIDPGRVTAVSLAGFTRKDSGRVRSGDWDLVTRPIESLKKFAIVRKKMTEGVSWEDAGAYDHMMQLVEVSPGIDGCFNREDVVKRYEALDELISQVNNLRGFRTRKWVDGFREDDGVYVHIGRNGELLFGNGGSHRLAIAQIMGVKVIPAQVGVVHEMFVKGGHYPALLLPMGNQGKHG